MKIASCKVSRRKNNTGVIRLNKVILVMMLVVFSINLTSCGGGSSSGTGGESYPEADYTYVEEDAEPIAPGNLFYIAKNGNDSNPGTEAQPWLTLQKAADTLTEGQKVYVKEGVYNERVTVKNSGTDENYIIFSAYSGQKVIIDGTGIASDANMPHGGGLFTVLKGNYIKIKGFKVRNARTFGIYAYSGGNIIIKNNYTYNTFSAGIITENCADVTIDGNEVVLATNPSPVATVQQCLAVVNCSDFEVSNNHVHHNGVVPKDSGYSGGEGLEVAQGSIRGEVHHNVIHDIGKVGLYLDAWNLQTQDIEVYANVVYHCLDMGLACGAEDGGALENIKIYNNLVYENQSRGIAIGSWGVSGQDHRFENIYIYNNTVYHNQYSSTNWGYGIHIDAPQGENIIISNNISYQNWNDSVTATSETTGFKIINNNLEGKDPLFVDPDNSNLASVDLRLKTGSPAIDQATGAYIANDDFDGKSRPSGSADIGAFEY
jgi:hypothetical protein